MGKLKRFIVTAGLLAMFMAPPAAGRENDRLRYGGFKGGMMIHSGYTGSSGFQVTANSGGTEDVRAAGTPFGIGGAIRFMFGKHLRIGTEGYVSNLRYGKHGSEAETGWGGLLADYAWDLKGSRIFVGGTVGGGSQTNTIILSPTVGDYATDEIAYRKYGFMAFAPFIGMEIPLTGKLDLALKVDWLLNISREEKDFVSGPRLYIGFMFGHKK